MRPGSSDAEIKKASEILRSVGLQWNLVGFNEGPRNCENMFAIRRFCYIEVLFHINILQFLGRRISFVVTRISLYRGSTRYWYRCASQQDVVFASQA